MLRRIRNVIWHITPRIYNLPQVVRVVWMGTEYLIPKEQGRY